MTEPYDAVDVIGTKRDGKRLDDEQIDWVVDAYTRGVVAPTSRCRRWRWRSCSTAWTATRSRAGPQP